MSLSGRNSQFTKREIAREIFRTVFWGAPGPESIKMARLSVKSIVHMFLDLIPKDGVFLKIFHFGSCALK